MSLCCVRSVLHSSHFVWMAALVLGGCKRATPAPAPANSASTPTGAWSPSVQPRPSGAAVTPAASGSSLPASLEPPTVRMPELPPVPRGMVLSRLHPGDLFFAGILSVESKIGQDTVFDSRSAYIEVSDGKLEGLLSDQRGVVWKATGTESPDGSFELREEGAPSATIRGVRTGDELRGDMLVSAWGEFSDYAPLARRFPFKAERKESKRSWDGIKMGTVGKTSVRMRLGHTGEVVTGEARYQRGEVGKLEGQYDTTSDRIVLSETRDGKATGRMSLLAFDNFGPAYGVWTPADGSQSSFIALGTAMQWADTSTLSASHRVEPRYVLYFGRSCIFDHIWPVVIGPGLHVGKVNRDLAAWSMEWLDAPTCNEATVGPLSSRPFQEQASYEVHPLRGGRFGIELSHWVDSNGAHGSGSKRCLLVDLPSGRIVEPARLIDDAKRSELTDLVTRKLLARNKVRSMAELRSGSTDSEDGPDKATVSADTDICLTEKGVDVAFEVYEIGPYSMNAPLVSLTRTEARPFFVKDELIESVLK